MTRVLVAAVLIVAGMAVIKDGRALHETGILSECAAVETPPGQTGYWQACRAGKLEGRPNLTRHSCVSVALAEALEYWRCEAPIASGTSG